MQFADFVGFSGVALLLIAFLLNLFKKLDHTSRTYMLLNLVGASIACTASLLIHYIPFVILEGTWALVSLVALIRSFKN